MILAKSRLWFYINRLSIKAFFWGFAIGALLFVPAGYAWHYFADKHNRQEQLKADAEVERWRMSIPLVIMPGKKPIRKER